MSKFCIDLEGMMLPDAIAAVVEAWYEAQEPESDNFSQKRILQSSEGVSKRAEWRQCAWYVRPATYSKLKKYVNRLQEMGRTSDASDVVDCALQMWMDDTA